MTLNVMNSTLNDIGNKFDYRKKEVLFDRFKGWFDNTTFTLVSSSMGWGKWDSDCGILCIGTASFDGGCWLDTVQHKTKANNQYNNFVNAFAYWDLMNDKGREFWLNYYAGEIGILKAEKRGKIADFESRIRSLKTEINNIDNEIISLNI